MEIYEKVLSTRKTATEIKCAVLPERMPMIPVDKLTEAQRKAGEEIASGPRGSLRGPFVPMIRSPGFMRRMQQLGEHGIIEVIGVAGCFAINSMIMNVARTPLRDGGGPTLAPLPEQLKPMA